MKAGVLTDKAYNKPLRTKFINLLCLQTELKSADNADDKPMTLQNNFDTFISKLDKFRSINQSSMSFNDDYGVRA